MVLHCPLADVSPMHAGAFPAPGAAGSCLLVLQSWKNYSILVQSYGLGWMCEMHFQTSQLVCRQQLVLWVLGTGAGPAATA